MSGTAPGGAPMAPPKIRSLASSSNIAITSVFVFLATCAVLVRIYARNKVTFGMGLDDWLIVPALFCCYGLLIVAAVCGHLGGIDYIRTDVDPIYVSSIFLKSFFVEPFFVYTALGLVKISILLFYQRLFVRTWFRVTCWILIAITAGWSFSVIVTQLNITKPISDTWNPLAKYQIDFNAFALAIAAISIVLDVIILCLPLFIIHTLHMRTKQKVLTGGILWLGVFCVIADALRLHYTRVSVQAGIDATEVTDRFLIPRQIWLWDRIAPCTSIICACLPTFGPLFKGRNVLESMLRSVTSWLPVGGSRQSSLRRSAGRNSESNSNLKDDVELHKLSTDTGDNRAKNGASRDGDDGAHKPNEGIQVTSTVALDYSRNGNAHQA